MGGGEGGSKPASKPASKRGSEQVSRVAVASSQKITLLFRSLS